MRPWPGTLCLFVLSGTLSGCPAPAEQVPPKPTFDPYSADVPPDPFEQWYPDSVAPPEGTQYAVRLVPLPGGMEGLPGLDHAYLNHVFSQILTVARANLRVSSKLGTPGQAEAVSDYEDRMIQAVASLEAEDVPKGLASFHDDLLAAISLQRTYVGKAAAVVWERVGPLFDKSASQAGIASERESALASLGEILEARAASAKLTAAWEQLSTRYTGHWSDQCRDAIFSHLRAMDF